MEKWRDKGRCPCKWQGPFARNYTSFVSIHNQSIPIITHFHKRGKSAVFMVFPSFRTQGKAWGLSGILYSFRRTQNIDSLPRSPLPDHLFCESEEGKKGRRGLRHGLYSRKGNRRRVRRRNWRRKATAAGTENPCRKLFHRFFLTMGKEPLNAERLGRKHREEKKKSERMPDQEHAVRIILTWLPR